MIRVKIPELVILWIGGFCLGAAFGIYAIGHHIFGQDVDCIKNNYPCSKVEIPVFKKAIHNSACQPDDETVNITGFCDPDDNDTDIEDQGLICFDDINMYYRYKEFFKNDTEFTLMYPCPPSSNLSPHEDESGK